MRGHDGNGAILADEMGLGELRMLAKLSSTGKTIQSIALIHTLLSARPVPLLSLTHAEQNMLYGAGPVIQRALIVCPVTLIKVRDRDCLPCDERRTGLASSRSGCLTDAATCSPSLIVRGRSHRVASVPVPSLRSGRASCAWS